MKITTINESITLDDCLTINIGLSGSGDNISNNAKDVNHPAVIINCFADSPMDVANAVLVNMYAAGDKAVEVEG